MKKVKFTVSGINCESCVAKIKNGLVNIAGVTSIDVDKEAQEIFVSGEDSFSNMQIKTALGEFSFPVSSMKKLEA